MYPCTCVSAYWMIKNKHDNKYLEWFKNTLRINCPYVFFGDRDTIELVKTFRKDLPTHYIEYSIEDFYTYPYRHNMSTHPIHCPSVELNLVWNEKLIMIEKASELNPFNSDYFAWVDAGVCVFRDTPPPDKSFPDINKLSMIPTNRFAFTSSFTQLRNSIICETNHFISGTSYFIHKEFVPEFVRTFKKYFVKCITSPTSKHTIFTDQVILTHMYIECPEMFMYCGHGYGEIIHLLY